MAIFCYRSISYAVSTSSGFVIVCFGTGVSCLLSLQPWTLWLYISVLGYQFYCHMDVVTVYFGTWVSVLLSLQPWTLWLYILVPRYHFYCHYSHGHCDCTFGTRGITFTVTTAMDIVTVHLVPGYQFYCRYSHGCCDCTFWYLGISFTVITALDVVTVHFSTRVSLLLSLQP